MRKFGVDVEGDKQSKAEYSHISKTDDIFSRRFMHLSLRFLDIGAFFCVPVVVFGFAGFVLQGADSLDLFLIAFPGC